MVPRPLPCHFAPDRYLAPDRHLAPDPAPTPQLSPGLVDERTTDSACGTRGAGRR